MYKAIVNISPKQGIVDPQGKTVQQALGNLGFTNIKRVRVGKHIVIEMNTETEEETRNSATEMCTNLLFNPLTEEYTIEVEKCLE